MVKKEKCSDCRFSKQKCLPEGRKWDSNEKQKCVNCEKGNRPCGPSENPPIKPPHQRRPRFQRFPYPSSVAPSAASEMQDADIGDNFDSICVTRAHPSCKSKELWDRLKDLDAGAALVNQFQVKIEAMENRLLGYNVRDRPEYNKLIELRHRTSQELLSRLMVVETLGDRAHAAGELYMTEITYTRMLEIYTRLPFSVAPFTTPLLAKMASFYCNIDQPLRAEKCLWDALKMRGSTGKYQCIDKAVWQKLAISLPETSRIISDALRSYYPDLFSRFETPSLKLESPFPPVHTMIQSEYSSDTGSNEAGHEPLSNDKTPSSFHKAITGGAQNLSEIIGTISESDLTARDILLRTPLFLAAFYGREDAGHALIMRIAKLSSAIQYQQMNARDSSGQTVLGIAILSDCSFNFIKLLIEHNAAVDPDPLPGPPTPLRAACMKGNAEVINLLLERGADINNVFRGNPRPADFAKAVQNDKIIQLTASHTESSHASMAALSVRQNSSNGDSIDDYIGSGPFPCIDATRRNIFQEDDEMPSGQFISELFSYPGAEIDEHLVDGAGSAVMDD